MAQDPGEIHTFLGWSWRPHHSFIHSRMKHLHLGSESTTAILGNWISYKEPWRDSGSPCRDTRAGLVCKLCLGLKKALYWTTHGLQVSELGRQRQQDALCAIGNKTRSSFVCHGHMYVLHVLVTFFSPSLDIESKLKRKSLKVGTEWLN